MIKVIGTKAGVKAEAEGDAHELAKDLAALTGGKVLTYETAKMIARLAADQDKRNGAGK